MNDKTMISLSRDEVCQALVTAAFVKLDKDPANAIFTVSFHFAEDGSVQIEMEYQGPSDPPPSDGPPAHAVLDAMRGTDH